MHKVYAPDSFHTMLSIIKNKSGPATIYPDKSSIRKDRLESAFAALEKVNSKNVQRFQVDS